MPTSKAEIPDPNITLLQNKRDEAVKTVSDLEVLRGTPNCRTCRHWNAGVIFHPVNNMSHNGMRRFGHCFAVEDEERPYIKCKPSEVMYGCGLYEKAPSSVVVGVVEKCSKEQAMEPLKEIFGRKFK